MEFLLKARLVYLGLFNALSKIKSFISIYSLSTLYFITL